MLEVIDHSELISPELLRVYNPVMQQLVIYAISANPLKCQKFVYWPSRNSLEQVKRRPGTTERHVFVEGNFTPLLSLTSEWALQSRRHKSIRDSVYGMLVALPRVKLNPRPLKKKKGDETSTPWLRSSNNVCEWENFLIDRKTHMPKGGGGSWRERRTFIATSHWPVCSCHLFCSCSWGSNTDHKQQLSLPRLMIANTTAKKQQEKPQETDNKLKKKTTTGSSWLSSRLRPPPPLWKSRPKDLSPDNQNA
jgi:hypothetical protein